MTAKSCGLKDEKMSWKSMFMSIGDHHESHFTDEETEAWKGKVACQRSHGKEMAEIANCPS